MLLRVEKPYLKSSFNLLLRKKWPAKISRFFKDFLLNSPVLQGWHVCWFYILNLINQLILLSVSVFSKTTKFDSILLIERLNVYILLTKLFRQFNRLTWKNLLSINTAILLLSIKHWNDEICDKKLISRISKRRLV